MPVTGASVVVGVDVGGTGLRLQVWYAGAPGPVRTAPGVRIGSAGIDIEGLVASAHDLLANELAAAPSPRSASVGALSTESAGASRPDVLVWSMRGLLFLAERTEVLRTVQAGLGARRTVVVSDAVASLVGAVGALRSGAVVAAGSGAVAFGTDFGSIWRRVDGWGHVLGDVGSGAWLGLAGLRAALRAHDGLPGGSDALLTEARARFGEPETWPRKVMAASDAPDRLASFAPVVTAAAQVVGDGVAADICSRAGAGLAESLLAAAKGLDRPVLVATGGVLAAPPVRAALVTRLAESGGELTPACGTALDGASILGARLWEQGTLPEHPAYLLVG